MKDNEFQTIKQITGVSPDQIKLANDGFWSCGCVIDNNRIVFKLKKSPKVKCKLEIKALEFMNSLNLISSIGDLFADNDSEVGIIVFSKMCYFDELVTL